MARATYVKSARKDNPVAKVGEPYYWWSFRYGGKRYSTTPPRPSQLVSSDKLSRALAAGEVMEDIDLGSPDTMEAVLEAVSEAADQLSTQADEVRDVGQEYRDSAESIRSAFSESATADECDEKADALDSWADEIESAADELRALEADEDENVDDPIGDLVSAAEAIIENVTSCPL